LNRTGKKTGKKLKRFMMPQKTIVKSQPSFAATVATLVNLTRVPPMFYAGV